MSSLAKKRCVPCEGDAKPLSKAEAQKFMKELSGGWMLIDSGHMLAKTFMFKDFMGPMRLANKIAAIADEENHHPDFTISYGSLGVELMTHAINGLSENDFILAAKIDEIQK